MAKKTQVVLIDDIDGSQAEGTVKFGLDGEAFEIDLSLPHQKELRDSLEKFREAGTRLGRYSVGEPRGRRSLSPRTPRLPTDRQRNDKIRAWANEQGKQVSPRGRIPQAIIAEYEQNHS